MNSITHVMMVGKLKWRGWEIGVGRLDIERKSWLICFDHNNCS